MNSNMKGGCHLVVGISGTSLSLKELNFLKKARPSGIIFFSRNLGTIFSLREMIQEIRAEINPPPTFWIDQEGGRVQRLREPFTRYPSPFTLTSLARKNAQAAATHAQLMGQLCGQELASVGIGVNCAPVLDIRESMADPVIGERAFGESPEEVIQLAGAWTSALSATGIMAIGKHFPGHGAARADSHKELPIIDKNRHDLEQWEWRPFVQLAPQLPALMTAHLVANGLDPQPATWSSLLLRQILRNEWHYPGLLVSDALEMGALRGPLDQRALRAIDAGCDLVLCCTGVLEDGEATLSGIEQALAQQEPDHCLAWEKRIHTLLSPYRIAPGDPEHLLNDTNYQRNRALIETLSQETIAQDPTESLSIANIRS
ncbi:MAG: beta-N-acetylhexosaminidase [Magnetococcus sp. DMHC-6]